MADTHDTIDGLLAEFRGYSAGMPPSYHVTMSWADFRKMLDRIEAAHKRELDALNEQIADLRQQRDLWSKRAAELVGKCNEQYAKLKQVGDAAKLREALSDACYAMFNFLKTRSGGYEEMANALGKAKAALADTSNQNTQEEN